MELLFRLDQSALPERPMDERLKLNISDMLNEKLLSLPDQGDPSLSTSVTYELTRAQMKRICLKLKISKR